MRRLGIGSTSSIVVAVSGGADSTALLDALARSRERDGSPKTIISAHLNHQLRGEESDGDEKFVEELSERFGLTCVIERIDVADQMNKGRQNLEAAARRIRYDFLQRVAEGCAAEMVLTAHTQDDQAETILMRLLRGSGPEGLRGIHEIRSLGPNVKLMRPMLDITRDDVLTHCRHYGIAFRTDISNLSTDFTRNRVRHELSPLLRTFNPRIDETLIRTSRLITDDEDYLHRTASELFSEVVCGSRLDLALLKKYHPAIRRRILRIWLERIRGELLRIDATHLYALEKLMTQWQSGRTLELPGGWRVRREFDQLVLFHSGRAPFQWKGLGRASLATHSDLPQDMERMFGGFRFTLTRHVPRESLIIKNQHKDPESYTIVLRDCNELDDIQLRSRRSGDAYVPAGREQKIKLKTLMIRHKIPISQRDLHPVLVTREDEIIWSPGLPVAKRFAAGEEGEDEETNYILVIAQKIGSSRVDP